MTDKYSRELLTEDGQRRAVLSQRAVSEVAAPRPGDIIVLTGAEWNVEYLEWLSTGGGRETFLVQLCYDIIPLMFPSFFLKDTVASFRRYFHRSFARADLSIFTARRIESDARGYCSANRIPLKATAVFRLGARIPSVAKSSEGESATALPHGLIEGRYALYVSTIEPRKGHALLFAVWKRLLAEGIPQAHDFKLVLIGRRGWLVDALLAELDRHPSCGDTLLIFSHVSDEQLRSFYHNAAFCLYPSLYEGFGLPIIEALSYGKAVLASSAGALPETVGNFSPCLDPGNEDLWYQNLKRWIIDPSAREPYERVIRNEFRPYTWEEAAASFFSIIDTAAAGLRCAH